MMLQGWQEEHTVYGRVYGRVVCGAVHQLQVWRGGSAPVMERRSGVSGDEKEASWLGQLWLWMGEHGIKVRLRGASATARKREEAIVDYPLGRKQRMAVVAGCASAGIRYKSDILSGMGCMCGRRCCLGVFGTQMSGRRCYVSGI
jgi:hypothetical protein